MCSPAAEYLWDASVVVAVGDEEVAVGGDGEIGGQAEGFAGGALLAGCADGHDELALGVEFEDAVGLAFGAPDVVFVVDEDSVGVLDDVFAPGGEEVAVAVEDDEGMLAARVDEYAVLGIAGDRGYPAELPTCGQFGPVFDYFVLIGAGSERHGNLLCLVETRCGCGGDMEYTLSSIREVTRRDAKNTLFCPRRATKGREENEARHGYFGVIVRSSADWRHVAQANRWCERL